MGFFGRKNDVGELNEKVADILDKGFIAYEQGDYSTSARKFGLALDYLLAEYDLGTQLYISGSRVSDIGEVLNMTVQSFINTGSFDEAISLIDRNEKNIRNKKRTLLMKASIHSARGASSAELQIYDTLLKMDKKDTMVYIKKAQLLSRSKTVDEGELREILNKAARNHKASDVRIGVKLATAYRTLLGDHDASQYVIDRLISKEPTKEMLLEQAELHIHAGKVEEGITCLEKALGIDPDHLEVIGSLVKAYRIKGDHQGAREMCERGLRLEPSNSLLQKHYRELSGDSGIVRKVKTENTYL
ncbi:MAG: hypothetical protein JXA22_01415 [Candidatus Thermoplasmatota archaeon]|nr:hypothetical protein [Candidatus Thermoplasmatota archaeon]